MSKEDVIEVEGKVVEALPNAMFEVELIMDIGIQPISQKVENEFY